MHTMEFRVKEGKKPLRNESSSSSLFFFLFFIISLIYYLKKIILLQYYWTKYYSTLFQHKIVWQSNVFVIMKMPSAEFYDVLDASCLPLLIFLRLRENMGVVRQLPNYELTTTRTCSDTSNFFTVARKYGSSPTTSKLWTNDNKDLFRQFPGVFFSSGFSTSEIWSPSLLFFLQKTSSYLYHPRPNNPCTSQNY